MQPPTQIVQPRVHQVVTVVTGNTVVMQGIAVPGFHKRGAFERVLCCIIVEAQYQHICVSNFALEIRCKRLQGKSRPFSHRRNLSFNCNCMRRAGSLERPAPRLHPVISSQMARQASGANEKQVHSAVRKASRQGSAALSSRGPTPWKADPHRTSFPNLLSRAALQNRFAALFP
jgi:hypothetical protein